MNQIELCVTWLAARIQSIAARFDPEVLQWPGGGFIAVFLWLYAAVRHEQLARRTAAFSGLASTP
jgi:hypothetical protein